MKSFILSGFILLSHVSFAQVDFDINNEISKIAQKIDKIDKRLDPLYDSLNKSQGEAREKVQLKIDNLYQEEDLLFTKDVYLRDLQLESYSDDLSVSNKLRKFKNAKNEYFAMIIRDSKGQIISHESVRDLYNEAVSKEEEYACYKNEEYSDFYSDENIVSSLDKIVRELGYSDYKSMISSKVKTFCKMSSNHLDEEQSPECSDLASGARLTLLENVENLKKNKREEITKLGYFNASDELFLEYDIISRLLTKVEDIISPTEALCIDERLERESNAFNYLQEEIKDASITIEFEEVNTKRSRASRQ